MLAAFKLKLYPNWKAKQRIFTHFFGGMEYAVFQQLCENFFRAKGEDLIYKEAETCIRQHIADGNEVVIISASVEDWVKPFATYLGVKQLLATQLELTSDGLLTGRFASANCYGAEKVERLRSLYPNRNEIILTAYGDSRGDKELLAYADVPHYKFFNK
jgi:HAD superfamily hydrolase (TIGR01490 family)